MSIYQVDRVQYIESQDTIILFEFYLVDNIDNFIKEFKGESEAFKNSYIEEIYLQKLRTLWDLSVKNETNLFIIIYDEYEDKILFIERSRYKKGFTWDALDFKSFQRKFIDLNNMSGAGESKKLGSVRQDNKDTFTLNILENISNDIDSNDDNGLALTKKLLGNFTTKGFDFDLFQYIESTGETVIYEFLKNETSYIKNYTANPMRYCWTGKPNDNKQKFISLWLASQKLNGRLFLINYSENTEEGIGISEIIDLDVSKGILQENKYNLTYHEFITLMIDMNRYDSEDMDYMKKYNYKMRSYNEIFFRNWDINKKNYGKT